MLNWQQDFFAGYCTFVHTIKHRVVYQLTYYDWCLIRNEVYWFPMFNLFFEFWISESEFGFVDFSTAEFKKKSDGNLWNQKWNRNSASDGGPRNQNQKLEFPTKFQPLVVYRTVLKKCHLSSGTGSLHVACLSDLSPILLRSSIARVICPSTYAQDPSL